MRWCTGFTGWVVFLLELLVCALGHTVDIGFTLVFELLGRERGIHEIVLEAIRCFNYVIPRSTSMDAGY